jgi:hypothetical protein
VEDCVRFKVFNKDILEVEEEIVGLFTGNAKV